MGSTFKCAVLARFGRTRGGVLVNPRVIWEALLSNRGGASPDAGAITLRFERLDGGHVRRNRRKVKVLPILPVYGEGNRRRLRRWWRGLAMVQWPLPRAPSVTRLKPRAASP